MRKPSAQDIAIENISREWCARYGMDPEAPITERSEGPKPRALQMGKPQWRLFRRLATEEWEKYRSMYVIIAGLRSYKARDPKGYENDPHMARRLEIYAEEYGDKWPADLR